MKLQGLNSMHLKPLQRGILVAVCMIFSNNVHAQEGWKIRYPTGGTLGPELSVYNIKPSVITSIAVRNTQLTELTDKDGNQARTPSITNAQGVTQNALVDFKQQQTIVDIGLGYVFPTMVADGRVIVSMNIPYFITAKRNLSFPEVSAIAADGSSVTPGAGYINSLNDQKNANDVSTEGLGDTQINTTWVYVKDKTKFSLGLAVILPTGEYHGLPSGGQGTPAINLGAGKYYTTQPSTSIAYRATDKLTVGARATLGFNTTNKINDWKSGDFAALELAASYKTPIGVFGTQVVNVKQYQDDIGGQAGNQPGGYGANRFELVNAGLFYMTKVKDIGLIVSYTGGLHAENALISNILSARLTKVF